MCVRCMHLLYMLLLYRMYVTFTTRWSCMSPGTMPCHQVASTDRVHFLFEKIWYESPCKPCYMYIKQTYSDNIITVFDWVHQGVRFTVGNPALRCHSVLPGEWATRLHNLYVDVLVVHAVVVQSSFKQTTRIRTLWPSTEALSSPTFLCCFSLNGFGGRLGTLVPVWFPTLNKYFTVTVISSEHRPPIYLVSARLALRSCTNLWSLAWASSGDTWM